MLVNQPVEDLEKMEALIKNSTVCRLGINNGKTPYIVPLNFGYHDNTLYFHSGPNGKKLELLKSNPNVCFELDRVTKIVEADKPCSWSVECQSVIGSGKVKFIENAEYKIKALKVIISQYTDRQMNIPEAQAKSTVVFQITIDNMTYKQKPA